MTARPPSDRLTHIPVMADEFLQAVCPRDGETVVDGTAGRGGHTRLFLEAANCTVIAIDRDPQAIDACRRVLAPYGDRVRLVPGRFGDLDRHVRDLGIDQVDAVGLDLGTSSPQLDDPERGFSFRFDGPLDMRMGDSGQTAADWINSATQAELSEVIREFGEERHYRRVAKSIVEARKQNPFETTAQLARIVRSAVGRSADGLDPATRTFQAIRIKINDETGEISRGLAAAERILRPGGRLAVISFHSLEDRLVKQFLHRRSTASSPSRHAPVPTNAQAQLTFTLPRRRSLTPSKDETRRNPRARSARLRAAVRTDAPVQPQSRGTAA